MGLTRLPPRTRNGWHNNKDNINNNINNSFYASRGAALYGNMEFESEMLHNWDLCICAALNPRWVVQQHQQQKLRWKLADLTP